MDAGRGGGAGLGFVAKLGFRGGIVGADRAGKAGGAGLPGLGEGGLLPSLPSMGGVGIGNVLRGGRGSRSFGGVSALGAGIVGLRAGDGTEGGAGGGAAGGAGLALAGGGGGGGGVDLTGGPGVGRPGGGGGGGCEGAAGGAGKVVDRGTGGGLPNDGGFPRFDCPAGLSFGIPPANKPASWGGPAPPIGGPEEPPPVTLPSPAEMAPAAPPPDFFAPSTAGALRSFVTAFRRPLPFWISARSLLSIVATLWWVDLRRGD